MLLPVFFVAGLLAAIQGLFSFISGLRFLAFVKQELASEPHGFCPVASIIAPFRGHEESFADNVVALLEQDYPAYEIIFVTDNVNEPGLRTIEEALNPPRRPNGPVCKTVIAGPAFGSGQKVHNLIAGVNAINAGSEILVFVDLDARVPSSWLRSLIAPLANEPSSAVTGYRWYIPRARGIASHVRAVWNASIASALGPAVERNFCWGGSTAIARTTFGRLQILEKWRGAASDDFIMTRALQEVGLPITFTPRCLAISRETCSFGELVEFTTRQVKITRVYAAHLWRALLMSSTLFVLVFYGGIALMIAEALSRGSYWLPFTMVLLIYLFGSGKAYLRVSAVKLALGPASREISAMAHITLWPFATALYAFNAVAALFSRSITWRGITYELNGPNETVIIRDRNEELAIGVE